MKYLFVIAITAFVLLSITGCQKVVGDGPIVSETRVVREFTELEFGVPGELEFIESEHQEVVIEAQRNIADVIETYVTGNELRIKVRDGKNIRTSEPVRIVVKAPNVHSFAVSGSGIMRIDNIQQSHMVRLKLSGSGNMIAERLESANLEARISGSGRIEVLEGLVEHEDIAISGSGDVDLVAVEAKKASTQTSGSGNIRLNVSDELEVRISGSGDVFYKGSPVVNVSVSGSGRLVKL